MFKNQFRKTNWIQGSFPRQGPLKIQPYNQDVVPHSVVDLTSDTK